MREKTIAFDYFRKTVNLKPLSEFWSSLSQFLPISGFWVFQDCHYARLLNLQGYTWFTYFRKYERVLNMHWDAIMGGFWIFQNSKYARFLQMHGLDKVLNMPEYGWKMPDKLFWLWQSSEYAWPKFQSVLNIPQHLNMPGLGIW